MVKKRFYKALKKKNAFNGWTIITHNTEAY